MSCQHDCERPPQFPRLIANRPGLPIIDYRIGSYAEMRAHMLARLDQALALARWTHRGVDDPGIALIEGAAIVGDILAFYQQLYANEAFLRTARWRESVADLVRLLGYRLSPGLGGHARFALAVKGDKPVSIPKGFGLKVELDGAEKPAVFETTAAATAYPHLSRFHLYRPRYAPPITSGTDTFYVVAAAGNITLKAGDRVLAGVERTDGAGLDHSQVLIVDKSWESFGQQFVKMKGAVTGLRPRLPVVVAAPAVASLAEAAAATGLGTRPAALASASLARIDASSLAATAGRLSVAGFASAAFLPGAAVERPGLAAVGELHAYRLGGSFRHFGHNAPPTQIVADADGRAQAVAVPFVRRVDQTTFDPAKPALASTQIPLDGDVDGIAAGTTLLVEANLSSRADGGSSRKRVVARTIRAVERQSLAWGPTSGASTVLTVDRDLAVTESGVPFDRADIRTMTFHQVEGEAFALRAALRPTPARAGAVLEFYGTAAEVAALDKRTLLLAGPGAALAEANVVAFNIELSVAAASRVFRRVTLDREVDYQGFDHDQPAVAIFGNLVSTTEGKTENDVTLGSGDAGQAFQTFPLPKPPLTYLLDPAHEPPHAPELAVYVDGRPWERVDSLFERGPRERIYVVREDADGKSFVQFGDGKTGARLPSGSGNVVALFRTGSGASGPLKAGAQPQAASRLPGFDAAFMPDPVTGGSAPEAEDCARVAAPGRMQSLARLVSLADFEAEALAIAGVLTARALWTIMDGTPHVVVTVLTQSQSSADAAAIADALSALYQARGPARYPVAVVQGKRRQLRIDATVGCDPTFGAADIRSAILDALGAGPPGDEHARGLFSWQRREFGQEVHGSHIVAAMQNVPGVVWVRLTAVGHKSLPLVPAADASLQADAARVPPMRRRLACPDDSILALDAADLTLSLVQADPREVS